MAEKTVGKPIKRTEDPRLIQGLAHYVDDIRLPDTLHAMFLRSIYAHARIKSIDVTAALKLPGVVAVYTGKDLAKVGPVPCGAAIPEMKAPAHAVLATDKVYFVGHPVAVVVAETKFAARGGTYGGRRLSQRAGRSCGPCAAALAVIAAATSRRPCRRAGRSGRSLVRPP